MVALVIILITAFAMAEPTQFENHSNPYVQNVAFVDTDDGDIGQIFGTSSDNKIIPVEVMVEEPAIQAQAMVEVLVNCYQTSELVRDLTVPYEQRSYIHSDGTTCTPVE